MSHLAYTGQMVCGTREAVHATAIIVTFVELHPWLNETGNGVCGRKGNAQFCMLEQASDGANGTVVRECRPFVVYGGLEIY
jgi:hypothetical protein